MAIDWANLVSDTLGQFTQSMLPPNIKVPALPQVVTKFIQAASNPDVEFKVLAKIIETDSGLMLELLKHVNSARYGLRTRVCSAQQALSLLGLGTARNLLITVGTKAAIQSRQSRLVNQNCFWMAALQKALFAREIAGLLNTDKDIAFNGALLQDFLLPVLTNELYEQYHEFVQKRDGAELDIWSFEQATFGWDHSLAGACLAKTWNFPDEFICCILFHHEGLEILSHPELARSSVAAVALSALLPDQLRQCEHGLEQLLELEKSWPAFNLRQVAELVDAKQAESGLGIRNEFPLARACEAAFGKSPIEPCASVAAGS